MKKRGSIFIGILSFLVIIGFFLAANIFYFYQKEKEKALALQEVLDETRARFKLTEIKLEETQKELTLMETKFNESKNMLDTLNSELEKEKKAKDEALNNLNELKRLIQEKEESEKLLEEELGRAKKEVSRLKAKLKNVEEERAELEKKIKDMEYMQQKIELGEIKIDKQGIPVSTSTEKKEIVYKEKQKGKGEAPAGTVTVKTPLEGKILVVNKDYGFVVINLGSQEGVNIDDVFSVYHKGKYIGDIKVEKLHDSMSAAGFLSSQLKDKVAEGDKVVLKIQ
ncbi:MAG: hypothetical protein NC826_00360 [Candidatus Omnitrophica bacterium]|nr:hypothetical protein [Candidatus Omnitrophota bacterium]